MAALHAFEMVLETTIKDNLIPGAVLFAKDKTGRLNYTHSAGLSSLNPPHAINRDTILTLASASKLLTTICALQQVERGLLSLDDDVSSHLRLLASLPVLLPSSLTSTSAPSPSSPAPPTATPSSSPSTSPPAPAPTPTPPTVPRTTRITLRHLLTHTSGLTYPFLSPALSSLKSAATGSADPFYGSTLAQKYGYPLLFQPGSGWAMGPSIDFAGRLVEVVSRMDLESYFVKNVLGPLGIERGDMTFWPGRVGALLDGKGEGEGTGGRMARVVVRIGGEEGENGKRGRSELRQDDNMGRAYEGVKEALGGEGVYASLEAYGRVLESLLMDDGRLLRTETVQSMFKGQLGEEAKRSLNSQLENPGWVVGPVPRGRYDWGLGGMVFEGYEDGEGKNEGDDGKGEEGGEKGHRKKRMMYWGGMFNTTWFIDREAGVCGAFGTQMLPVRDPGVSKLHEQFEAAVYKAAKVVGDDIVVLDVPCCGGMSVE